MLSWQSNRTASPPRPCRQVEIGRARATPISIAATTIRSRDSVGYLLKQLRNALDRLVDAEMAEHDLTGVQWGPLLMIHYGLGTTAAEIARIGCVDTGAVTRMLDRLEAKGLLRRTPCPKDRRVIQLELTAEGERLCREIPFGLARVSNRLAARLHAARSSRR